jgi:hypothetical protein
MGTKHDAKILVSNELLVQCECYVLQADECKGSPHPLTPAVDQVWQALLLKACGKLLQEFWRHLWLVVPMHEARLQCVQQLQDPPLPCSIGLRQRVHWCISLGF